MSKIHNFKNWKKLNEANTPDPNTTTNLGSMTKFDIKSKDSIWDLQKALNSAGAKLTLDGIWGTNTKNAVMSFQKKNNMTPDGIVGSRTLAKLKVTSVGNSLVPSFVSTSDNTRTDSSNRLSPDFIKEPDAKPKKNNAFAIGIAWTEYNPAPDEGWQKDLADSTVVKGILKTFYGDKYKKGFGPQGHAGVTLIAGDGTTVFYEFGRYGGADKEVAAKWYKSTKEGKAFISKFEKKEGKKWTSENLPWDTMGTVQRKYLGKIAKIKNGKIINLNDVIAASKKSTKSKDARTEPVYSVVIKNIVFADANAFAKSNTTREYKLFDDQAGGGSNCGTYVLDTIAAGGADVDVEFSMKPNNMISNLKDSKDFVKAVSA